MKPQTFKEYAKLAKQRLCSGFWEKVQKEQDATSVATKATVFDSIYNRQAYDEQKEFVKKVQQVLKNSEQNPIMQLADQEYLATLSPDQRQNYLLKLSQRFLQAKEILEKEQRESNG
ncbi:MAG: hypothetical protein J6R37_02475 [Clostridia bacterium]|nr:hypothetical protein [Clostridia bacterium]